MIYARFAEKNPFTFERHARKAKSYDLKLEPHYHNFFEIYYVEKGSCDYFIDNKAYHLEKAEDYRRYIVNLPCSTNLSEADCQRVIDAVLAL